MARASWEFRREHQRHDIRHFPKACLDTSGHRGRDAKRSVTLHEVVEREVQGQHVKVVRGLLAMRSGQPREAAHMLAHFLIVRLHAGSRDVRAIRKAVHGHLARAGADIPGLYFLAGPTSGVAL